jgi:hypothetical protein
MRQVPTETFHKAVFNWPRCLFIHKRPRDHAKIQILTMKSDRNYSAEPNRNLSLRNAKEWAAVTLCVLSAVGTFWAATTFGIDVCLPLAASCMIWALAGAWLGDLFRPYSRALVRIQMLRARIVHFSPLSKMIFKGSAALLAGDVLFKTSQAFLN